MATPLAPTSGRVLPWLRHSLGSQEVLEDRGGGEGIAQRLLLRVRAAALRHARIGIRARESLILKMNRQIHALGERECERAHGCRRRAIAAIHIERKPDDDRIGRMFLHDSSERVEERRSARCVEHENRLDQAHDIVAGCDARALVADVERKVAHWVPGAQRGGAFVRGPPGWAPGSIGVVSPHAARSRYQRSSPATGAMPLIGSA